MHSGVYKPEENWQKKRENLLTATQVDEILWAHFRRLSLKKTGIYCLYLTRG